MVVVATPNYTSSDVPAVTRIQNAAGNSFDVRLANPSGSAVSPQPVHYLVVEEGVFTQAEHGITLEAVKFNSSVTGRKNAWSNESRSYINSYSNPVVLGQVMSYVDPDWSVFWAQGSSRTSPPSASALAVGKHVGEDTDIDRADETLAYIVVEAGSGNISGLEYAAGVGSDIVRGMANSPPFSYAPTGVSAPTSAVASVAALDGGDGGWALLYGANPVSLGNLDLSFDEDQVGNSERNHTTEQVAYMVFGAPVSNLPPTASFTHGCTGLDCGFTDTSADSDGTIASWSWGFGDGNTSTAQNPNHSYAAAGGYTVSMTVTDDDGATDNVSTLVTATDPPPPGWIELTFDNFEGGWGNWIDGGSDARLSSYFAIGSQAMALQDNSSTSYSEMASSLDLSGYSELQIEFSYVVQSFENSEDFWVRFSSDGGSTWTTIQAFVNNVDFVDDGTRYDPVITIDSGSYTFNSKVKIMFQCDASGNRDDVYFDDVRISAQ
jgi:PKD repeat protein